MSNLEDVPPSPPDGGSPSRPGAVALYPARLEIAYPDRLNRVTTAFRLVLVVPIVIVSSVLTAEGTQSVQTSGGAWATTTSAGITGGLSMATLLLILFRRRYPRWWFDFALELTRFTARVGAYVALLTEGTHRRLGALVYEPALAGASAIDKSFLLAMTRDNGPSKMADMQERLGVDVNYASQYRLRLIVAELIESTNHGYVDFALPYLREYLRDEAAAEM